jgi:hypothetical protein
MNTKRIIAKGYINPGQMIKLTVPADWPTEEELAVIRQRCQCQRVVVEGEKVGEEFCRQPYLY